MKRKSIIAKDLSIFLCILLLAGSCKLQKDSSDEQKIEDKFSVLLSQVDANYSVEVKNGGKKFFPRSLTTEGAISYIASNDWCSGFFPGCLWLMTEYTGDTSWQRPAEKYTGLIENEKWNGRTHDMGFKVMCSFGNGFRQTNDTSYASTIVQAAKTLITRYNEKVGCIRSWDHNADKWSFPVIIDNMMNLELLFKATEITRDSTFYRIAVSHANTTLKNHFRNDNSSYHVVDYFPKTGEIHEKVTHQGDSNESAWARGQAWGLYGYTMCYRFTGDQKYVEQAKKIADYIFTNPNLPTDKIPMWDFNYNTSSGEPRDVSAAAVIASALYELSAYAPGEKDRYIQLADDIIDVLKKDYSLQKGEKWGYLLDHSVGFRHMNHEVDVPIIYADYYFLEALIRQKNLKN